MKPDMSLRTLLVFVLVAAAACTPGGQATPASSAPPQDKATATAAATPTADAQPAMTWSLERENFAGDVPSTDVSAVLAGAGGSPWVVVGTVSETAAHPRRPTAWTGRSPGRWDEQVAIDDDTDEGASVSDVARSRDVLIAVGERWEDAAPQATAWRSSDGAAWERVDLPTGTNSDLWEVVGTRRGFVAAGTRAGGDGTGAQPLVLRSADGEEWEAVEVESPPGADAVVHGLLATGTVAVGYTRGADSKPLAWRLRGGRYRLVDVPRAKAEASISSVVAFRGALHAFGVEGSTSRTVAYWRSDDDGRSWRRMRGKGGYLDQTRTSISQSGSLQVGRATATRRRVYVALSDGPANLLTTTNLKRWELMWPATPKGSYYVPQFDGVASSGSQVVVVGDHLGGAFAWRYDEKAFRWQDLDGKGDTFGRDQVATTLRAVATAGETTVVGGSAGTSQRTDADAASLLSAGEDGRWGAVTYRGSGREHWFNVLLDTPEGLLGAGGRVAGDGSVIGLWQEKGGRWRQVTGRGLATPAGGSAFVTDGGVTDEGVVLAGTVGGGGEPERLGVWVRNRNGRWFAADLERFRARNPGRSRMEILPTAPGAVCPLPDRGLVIGSIGAEGPGRDRPAVWSGPLRRNATWRADRDAFPARADVVDCEVAGDELIAVGDVDGAPAVWTSTDGRTWEGGAEAVPGGLDGLVTTVAAGAGEVYIAGGVREHGWMKMRVWRRAGDTWEALADDPAFVPQENIEIRDAMVGEDGVVTIVGAMGDSGAVWRGEPPASP